jgi:hypothetical protein
MQMAAVDVLQSNNLHFHGYGVDLHASGFE